MILTRVIAAVISMKYGIGEYLVPMVWFDLRVNGVKILNYPWLVVVVYLSIQIAPFISCCCVMGCAQVMQFDVIQAML